MKSILKFASVLTLVAAASAADKLTKPALSDDLDYLLAGNQANLPGKSYSIFPWTPGKIPHDCRTHAQSYDHPLSEIEVYDVLYEDCNTKWVFCRHKDAESSIQTAASTFGKVPAGIRDWTRHVMLLPSSDGNGAFNDRNGNVVFFGEKNVNVYLHETGHSLDVLKGFDGVETNKNPTYLNAYAFDSHVPDNYAQTNHIENVAQNTVIAVYDINVPGGFPGANKDFDKIMHQNTAVKAIYGDVLKTGGKCGKRLEPSETIVFARNRKRDGAGAFGRVRGLKRAGDVDRF
ncbi:hypothetical protein BJY04DRAFT_201363 [Aspergillus karnatakaensis]|uniref:uncharacterized protein n=1 Tax=Aspergillus karnatakaensis TaxID=1810916 RepID=UPI003CCE06EB